MKSKEVISVKLVQDAKQIIETARENAVRSVDFCRVQMYWKLGKRIFEEEQHGKKRADYGAYIVKSLAEKLEAEYGSGFGIRQIERARQFFLLYPIASAVRTQLNWSQYKMLIAISDPDKREYYELEAVNNSWNGRELERQINSQLYERLLLSNDKESVLAVARKERIPETPQEVIKDPMVLEFLGLEKKPAFYETDLEGAIISHITELMTLPEGNKTILATEYNLYLPTTEQLVGEINEAKELVKKRTAMQQLSADAEMAGAIKKARSRFCERALCI